VAEYRVKNTRKGARRKENRILQSISSVP